jgi:anti-anti-sigma factor
MALLYEEHVDGVSVLHISGSLTMEGLPAVEARFGALAGSEAARVVADIGNVDAVTTPAITLMLKTAWAVKERGGRMVFANATPGVRRIFAHCGLDIVLDLVSDVATAVTALRSCDPDARSPFHPLGGGAGGTNLTH